MFQTRSIFAAVTLLMMQLCTAEKSCVIWSSAGHVVQRDSTFNIYCSFNYKCKRSMYSGQRPTLQSHAQLNSTTIYLKVVNITGSRTFSCQCNYPPGLDACGLDISAGYPPDRPKDISCTYKLQNDESGDVLCTWNRGRDTHLDDRTMLWVRSESGNHTSDPEQHNVTNKGSDSLSVNFTVARSVQIITVWVEAKNPLGSTVSSTIIYSLSDIAMPLTPVLGRPSCSSRECIIPVEQRVVAQHLEIQYKAAGETWTSYLYQSVQTGPVQDRSIPSLEPYRVYYFRVRSKFSTGQWSQWSTNISTWTQEEAPAEPLDVWYAEPEPDLKSPTVYWKDADNSVARGRIIDYRVRVYDPDSGAEQVTDVSADARNCSVPLCTDKCDVTVWARNSKGFSPPARVTARHIKAQSSQDVTAKADHSNVAISWRKRDGASFYVVEWFPEAQRLQELRWTRLDSDSKHAVITGIKPFVCYKGALYVFYNESSVSRNVFGGVATVESAPVGGPQVQVTEVEGHTVKVTWMELQGSKRRGCITKYTIYLKSSGGEKQHYSILATDRTYKIKDLPPADYSLWMTASTAEGEGPAGHRLKFLIQQEIPLSLLLVCGFVFAMVVLLVCLCQTSSVKQKFWVFFQCLMLDVVPDPANSKWAKECSSEKGKIKLQLSNSSVSQSEEDPVLVDVEELPKQNRNISASTGVSSQQSPDTETGPLLYPLTTYIKSLSHDSDSSDHTHASLDTNTTVDYISTHANMEEEEEEEEEEDATLDFFPSHNIFMEPFCFGGNLTLDTVKIDFCGDLFQKS